MRLFDRSFWVFGFLACGVFSAPSTFAAIRTESVMYRQGDTTLEGFLAFDDGVSGPRPGVLVVHEWMGLGEYAKRRARELAELGYVAFAADIYGKGQRPKNTEEAAAWATKYKSGDRSLLRARARAALDTLLAQKNVDAKRVAAIGYCFGGTTALELARSGAPLAGVISFHGHLDTPNSTDLRAFRGKVLVFHGADDPFVPATQVSDFQREAREAKVDWQLVSYGGAVHSFTVPDAGNDPSKGAAYHALADRRSFEAMRDFFVEIFGAEHSERRKKTAH